MPKQAVTLFIVALSLFAVLALACEGGVGAAGQPQQAAAHYFPAEQPSSLLEPGVSYTGSSPTPEDYVGVQGLVDVRALGVVEDLYLNNETTGVAGVSFQLAATVYSPAAGTYWGVVGLVLNQSSNGYFTFALVDQLWNETYTCGGPGTLDETTAVSGNGGVVASFPGCFGTHYEYLTPVLGVVRPPFNLTLGEYLVGAKGSFGIKFNYTLSTAQAVYGGTVDVVTVYPQAKPAPATMRVGGFTQLAFDYSMQLTISAPKPLQVAVLSSALGSLSLTPISQEGNPVSPNQTYNYGVVALSGARGVAVYPNLSDPNRPFALFSEGALHPASLWPVSVRAGYTVAQNPPGGTIQVAANFTYYDPRTGEYTPLPDGPVLVSLNSTEVYAELEGGVLQYSFEPTTYGYYALNLTYPPSLAFGKPELNIVLAVALLGSNMTQGSANFSVEYPDGSTHTISLQAGSTLPLLIPAGGLVLYAPTAYQYFGAATRFGFTEWVIGGGEGVSSPQITVSKPQELEALFGTQYLVSVSIPEQQPQKMWVSRGYALNLSAPQYIYLLNASERLVFTGWSNGAKGNTTIIVESPLNVSANYALEFKVYITTPQGVLVDAYYPNGTTLSVTAPATLGGSLLYPNTFQGWSGTVQSSSRTLRLTVTQPIVAGAVYSVSYARVSDIEVLAAVAVGAAVAYIAQRKRL